MTIEASIDTVIEIVKPIAIFVFGVATEAFRRWISAPKKEKDEFIDVSSEALEDGRITLQEGLTIFQEGKDVFIGIDFDDTMGKA